jgi:metal-dependent amidase/aminoacylase/carboxypeptidase family protein
VVNHPQATVALEQAAWRVVGREHADVIDRPSMGGEDFSVYLDHAPGALLRLGSGGPDGKSTFLHSPLFDIDERAIALGARILLRAALVLSAGLRKPPVEV